MKMLRPMLIGGALAAFAGAALAIQPGTTGTEKRFQQQALRAAVLTLPNKTATGAAGGSDDVSTATLNEAGAGVITTAAVATPADSDHSLTLTNNMIAAADIVLASVAKGTATVGSLYVAEITPAAGSVVIKVRNASGGTTANGTLKISFVVIKQSVLGAD